MPALGWDLRLADHFQVDPVQGHDHLHEHAVVAAVAEGPEQQRV